ncbi:MAG TPA: ATP synthase F0 subunit B [Vicinamibacterales bacterium]|nr:ATP synthase F0 subunit B [Vicinamibacterales bacterium]
MVLLLVAAPEWVLAAADAVEEGHDSWMPTIAKIVNFAALAGILVYFLRSPVGTYLRTRSETIRKDLVEAAALRSSAEKQLDDMRTSLARLPAELDELKRRGQEELAAERVRMKETTAREREKLLERTRRDIDLQFRLARRALIEHTADLAMSLARKRVERSITPDDHRRLIEQYAIGVRQERSGASGSPRATGASRGAGDPDDSNNEVRA